MGTGVGLVWVGFYTTLDRAYTCDVGAGPWWLPSDVQISPDHPPVMHLAFFLSPNISLLVLAAFRGFPSIPIVLRIHRMSLQIQYCPLCAVRAELLHYFLESLGSPRLWLPLSYCPDSLCGHRGLGP